MSRTSQPLAGRYPIARRQGESERLRIQADAMAFDAGIMLDRIGVGADWHCLDLGCGMGGITDLLARRMGPGGRVVGLDTDAAVLEAADEWVRGQGLEMVEFVQGNAYDTGLARSSFDLVHIRFVASTAGDADALLSEALALVKPGGVLALEEPDSATLKCYPSHVAWDFLVAALEGVFDAIGGDVHLARRLYAMIRQRGLEDVHYRPFIVGVTAADPMVDYLPQTIESVRQHILGQGVIGAEQLDAAIAECRRHLADPDTVFTTYLVAQVWGCKAG